MFTYHSKQHKSAGFDKPADLTDKQMRIMAINLLSRREYSLYELSQKLEPRSQNSGQVPHLLEYLVQSGYQSDQRFAESFLRSRISRALGPMRIKRELKDKGIDSDLIDQVFETDVDWFELAFESAHKKSQSLDLSDYKDKQKLYRYLAYRGFTMDHMQYAISAFMMK